MAERSGVVVVMEASFILKYKSKGEVSHSARGSFI